MIFGYIRLPAMFGIGRYQVVVELPPRTAGVYPGGNVTYRGGARSGASRRCGSRIPVWQRCFHSGTGSQFRPTWTPGAQPVGRR